MEATRKIMSEAKRLNMVGGHFIWLWLDTSSSTDFHNMEKISIVSPKKVNNHTKSDNIGQTTPRDSENYHKYKEIATTISSPTKDNKPKHDADKYNDPKPFNIPVTDYFDERQLPNFHDDFDPFRLNQHQDHQIKFDKTNQQMSSTKIQPVNRLILGLRSSNEPSVLDTEIHNKKQIRRNIAEIEKNFISKQSNNNSNENNFSITRNFSDDNILYQFIDNNNFDENSAKLMKRTSVVGSKSERHSSNSSASSLSVTFHRSKDFPVGLLALRPIRMNVDRYFIRSSIRLFAMTWAKIQIETNNTHTPVGGIISSRPTNQRNLKVERNKYGRKMRRKRNINTIDALLLTAIDEWKLNDDKQNQQQQEHKQISLNQVNSSLLNKNVSSESKFSFIVSEHLKDIRNYLNKTSDLINKNFSTKGIIKMQNISYNQNLSGLNVNNLTMSNTQINYLLKSLNSTSISGIQNVTVNAKSASESVVANFKNFNDKIRIDKITKRQNTWWTPNKPSVERIQIRGIDEASSINYKCETPHYSGGCYGNPSKLDIRNAEYFARYFFYLNDCYRTFFILIIHSAYAIDEHFREIVYFFF